MKKLLILAAVALMILPVSAMAGMTAFMDMDELSNADLAQTTGQAGITITLTQQITGGWIAWGDNDGCAGATGQGWLTLDGITSSAIAVTGLTIDVCTPGAGLTALTIGVPTQTISARINNIRLGNTAGPAAANSRILGHLVIRNLSLAAMTVQIWGH